MPVTEGRHRACYFRIGAARTTLSKGTLSLNLFLLAGNIKMLNFVDEMVIKR